MEGMYDNFCGAAWLKLMRKNFGLSVDDDIRASFLVQFQPNLGGYYIASLPKGSWKYFNSKPLIILFRQGLFEPVLRSAREEEKQCTTRVQVHKIDRLALDK
jgi:hypothetical protein